MTKIKKPMLIDKVFQDEDFEKLKTHLFNRPKNIEEYDERSGRYLFYDKMIDEYAQKLIPKAREIFESDTLAPSYSLFSHYQGNSRLFRHKDNNACTYTIDLCVYQNQPWDLCVEHEKINTRYTLYPNQALAYYGNDQQHWRDDFPNPKSQYVAMTFFHFVEPDHWWFTQGRGYLDVIRRFITEEEYQRKLKNK